MRPCTLAYTNRARSWEATFTASRWTAGFGVESAGDCAYAGNFAQSPKLPSMRMSGPPPVGAGDNMLARIGTMTMRATTAAMPMTERDQCGWGGIRGIG